MCGWKGERVSGGKKEKERVYGCEEESVCVYEKREVQQMRVQTERRECLYVCVEPQARKYSDKWKVGQLKLNNTFEFVRKYGNTFSLFLLHIIFKGRYFC